MAEHRAHSNIWQIMTFAVVLFASVTLVVASYVWNQDAVERDRIAQIRDQDNSELRVRTSQAQACTIVSGIVAVLITEGDDRSNVDIPGITNRCYAAQGIPQYEIDVPQNEG